MKLEILPEVEAALAQGDGVVALESTIITHGMPFPQNMETARRVEAAVRAEGAVPATIAVVGGRLRVGLDDDALETLGRGRDVAKLSRRDLPRAVVRGLDGGTTVAATMRIAAAASIEVFATGGIGGVHRGAAHTFDVSADLEELATSRVAVVCAGAKAILDLGATLEYLETRSVPVLAYRSDRFPAFYTRDSGHPATRVDALGELAAIVRTQWDLGLGGGVVVANPIPEEHEMDPEKIIRAIERALAEADEQGVVGKDVTPFLLARIKELSSGESLRANIALVVHNAVLAARLAGELRQ